MAKRRYTKKEIEGMIYLGFIVAIFVGIFKFFQTFGFIGPAAIVGGSILFVLLLKALWKWRRKSALLKKYGDPETVNRILKKIIWVGQTSVQLQDSLGVPKDVDESVYMMRREQVWTYRARKGSSCGLRVRMEDGIVIGWEDR